jgi:hypothetical protein
MIFSQSALSNDRSDLLNAAPISAVTPTSGITPELPRLQQSASLLFVDKGVSDYESLIQGAQPGTEVHVLDSAGDAIAQITQTLSGRSNIASVHIVSHGRSGGLQLGQDWLNLAMLQRDVSQLQSWKGALTEDADILLYGCNVAQGELGQAFVSILSQLTGADVAASDDITGRGGDWTLEVNTGEIATATAFTTEAMQRYQGALAPPIVTSIAEADADNTVAAGVALNYTVTFDQDIDASTVTVADFLNAGTASLTVNSVTQASARVFTVNVTPTTTGSLTLRVDKDAAGNIADITNNPMAASFNDNDTLTVIPFNTAPTLNPAATQPLTGIVEDVTSFLNTGTTVAALLGTAVTDPDTGAQQGVAVTGVDATNGNWQYSIDNGNSWISFTPTPTNARLLAADAKVRFVPTGNYFGNANITFRAWDRTSGTNGQTADAATSTGDITAFSDQTATQTITVRPVNDRPSFNVSTPAPAVNEDNGAVTIANWAASNVGPANESGQTVTYIVDNLTNPGLFDAAPTIAPDGTLTYTPKANTSGTSNFRVRVRDSGGTADGGQDTSIAQTFTLTINEVNDAPDFTATNPTAINEDAGAQTVNNWAMFNAGAAGESSQTGTYLVTGVTPNFFDAGPTIDASGNLTYTVKPNVFGAGNFSVQAQDSGGTTNGGVNVSAVKTFSIIVNPINDKPDFTAVTTLTAINEDAAAQTVSSWATFNPGNLEEVGQAPTYIVSGISNEDFFTTAPSVDTAGSLTYQVAANANGTVTFQVRVQDSGGTDNGGVNLSDPKTITLTVNSINDRPSFTVPTPLAPINEDAGSQTRTGWAVFNPGAFNEASQTPTYTVNNISVPSFFTTPPEINANGNLTFRVADNVFGTVNFDVTVNDGGGTVNGGLETSVTQTFTLTVNGVNDKPAFTAANPTTIAEGIGAQTIANWATFDSGAANESSQTALEYIVSNISDPNFFAVAPSILPSTGTLTYEVNENASGSVTFDVQVRDNGGTANGGINLSDRQTFTLNVTSVNDNPDFAAIDPPDITEDAGAQTIVNWATFFSGAPNESTQTATYTVTTSDNSFFSVLPSISSNGTLAYTVAPDRFGDVTLSVTVADNGAPGPSASSATKDFILTVSSVNDRPVLTAVDPSAVLEGQGLQTLPNWGTFLPGATNEAGQTALEYIVSNISNPSLFEVPPSIAANGTLTYKANANASGTSTFEVQVRDSGGTANGGIDTSNTSLITITVTGINDKPEFIATDLTVLEDAPAQTVANWSTFFAGAADESSQTATYTVSNISDGTFFAAAPAVTADGTLSYTLNPNVNGTVTFDVRVQDNGGTDNGGVNQSDIQTFTLTVTPVNDEPDFTATNPVAILEGTGAQTVTNWATFDAGPTDELSQTATYTVSNISDLNFFAADPVVASNGTLTYTVNTNVVGTVTFDVQVQDSGGTANAGDNLSTVKTFTLTVTGVNDQPDFMANNPATVLEDAAPQTIVNWATFNPGPTDEASQIATYTVSNISDNAFFASAPQVASNGTLTYTLNPNVNGTVTFDVQVQDSGGTANGGVDTSVIKTFTLNVTAVNDEPDFTAVDPPPVTEGAGLQTLDNWAAFTVGPANESSQTAVYLLDNISNPSLFETPPEVASDGTLTYTANTNASGTSTFTVQVRDDGGMSAGGDDLSRLQTFTINVTGVNDKPDFTAVDPADILEDAEAQTITNWATFFAGAVDENGQVPTYSVTNISDPGFFAEDPEIDAAGNLTYTFANDAFGEVTFDVAVQDDGGTANGGIDTSDTKTFTLRVTGVNDQPDFTAVDPPPIDEGAGLQTIANWAMFDAGAANETQSVQTYTVSNVTNSSLFDIAPQVANDGTLTYTPKANAFGTTTFNVTVTDDGGTADGGINTSTMQTFTITIDGVNDKPDFTAANPLAVNEDSGPQTIANWATFNPGEGEATQLPTYTVSNISDATLFDVTPTIDATGKLTYTPKANAFGTATFDVTVKDNGGTANGGVDTSDTKTFTLTVNSVNDVPTFVKGSDQLVFASEGARSIANWATNFNPGVPNESAQTLAGYVIASNDNPSLFLVVPSIADDGTLSYTPATNLSAAGTAKIGVRVQDSGGTANGGIDLSEIQYFNITVKPTTVSLLTLDANASEGAPITDTGVYQIKRDYSVGPMTINLTVDPSSTATLNDYALTINPTIGMLTQTGSTITVTLNDGISQADILLTPIDDIAPETRETLKLMVASGTGYAIDATNKEGLVTIQANDTVASIVPVRTGRLEGDSGTVAHTFTVKLSNAMDQPVTVNYSTLNGTATAGSDYVANSGAVVFATGETEKTITVLSNADSIEEANETFQVKLDSTSSGSISPTQSMVTGTIIDDDAKTSFRFTAANFAVMEGNENHTTRVVAIKRSGNLTVSSSVQVRLTGGTAIAGKDFVNELITVTFAAGQDTATVPIKILGDRDYGAQNESLTLSLVSLDPDATVEPTQPQTTLTLINDDPKPAFTGDYQLSTRIIDRKKFVVITRANDRDGLQSESTIFCRLNNSRKNRFTFKIGQTEMLLEANVQETIGVKLYRNPRQRYITERRLRFS